MRNNILFHISIMSVLLIACQCQGKNDVEPETEPVQEEVTLPKVISHKKYNVDVEELSGICLTADGLSETRASSPRSPSRMAR